MLPQPLPCRRRHPRAPRHSRGNGERGTGNGEREGVRGSNSARLSCPLSSTTFKSSQHSSPDHHAASTLYCCYDSSSLGANGLMPKNKKTPCPGVDYDGVGRGPTHRHNQNAHTRIRARYPRSPAQVAHATGKPSSRGNTCAREVLGLPPTVPGLYALKSTPTALDTAVVGTAVLVVVAFPVIFVGAPRHKSDAHDARNNNAGRAIFARRPSSCGPSVLAS